MVFECAADQGCSATHYQLSQLSRKFPLKPTAHLIWAVGIWRPGVKAMMKLSWKPAHMILHTSSAMIEITSKISYPTPRTTVSLTKQATESL